MYVLLAIVGILLAVGFYVMAVYNSLQTLLTQIEASIQEIGNQLKRQANLIPNLQTSVKAYLKQEKDIFSMLTEARKSVQAAAEKTNAQNLEAVERQLQAILPRLQVVVEDNPELKSNETIQQFMAELRDTADKLTYARRALIDLTQNFNQKLVTFPSNLVANVFGFKKQKGLATPMSGEHVEVSASETGDIKVDL
jgi:LemA protein